jgi:hypothetical protein
VLGHLSGIWRAQLSWGCYSAVVVTRDLVTRYHGTGPAVTRCLWRYSLPTRYSVTGVTAKWCEAVGSPVSGP